MIDPWNRIVTNLKIAETGYCSNISTSESDYPSVFPTLYISVIDNREAAMDLENSENGVTSDIRVQAFSNKTLTEARTVMSVACDAMRQMGYRRTFGPREIENVSDRNVKRCEARFRRFVNGSDIPRFDS